MALAPHVTAGWRKATLGEIGEYINGRGFKTSEWSDRGRMIIRIQDLTGTGNAPNYFAGECDERHVVRDGDLLISWAATLDAFIWSGVEGVLNQHIFKAQSRIDRRFHYYLVKYVLSDMRRRAHGSGMVHITKREFEDTPVVIPTSEAEQRQIVAVLEQQISRIDAAQADLLRVLRSLDVLRQSVAVAATSGRLVPLEADLGDRYESAQDFVRRCTRARSSWVPPTRSLPAGWTWARLRDLGELDRGGSRHRPRNDPRLYGGPYPFLQTGDIRRSQGTIRQHSQTYNETGLAQSRLWPAGTLCITIAANIAETAILAYPACFPDSVVGFVHDGDPATTRYVQLCMQAMKQRLWELAPATAQKNINLGTLEAIAIPLPPPSEQVRIVAEVDQMTELSDVAEAEARAAMRRSNGLRASALRWALTPGVRDSAT